MLEKCVLTILELNWNQRLGHKKTKLNVCHRMLTSSTQLQNRSFHGVERTRTSAKCKKMNNARAKRAKILFFIVKYANLWGFCCRRRRGCLSSLMSLGRLVLIIPGNYLFPVFSFSISSVCPSLQQTDVPSFNFNNSTYPVRLINPYLRRVSLLNRYSRAEIVYHIT